MGQVKEGRQIERLVSPLLGASSTIMKSPLHLIYFAVIAASSLFWTKCANAADPSPSDRGKKHPEELRGAKSTGSHTKTKLNFINLTGETVKVFWLDQDGRRDSRPDIKRTIKPGDPPLEFETNATFPFVVTDEMDNAFAIYYAEPRPKTVEIQTPRTDYSKPKREYAELIQGDWRIFIEKSLVETDPSTAHKAAARLAKNLDHLLTIIPVGVHKAVKDVKLFIMHGPQSPYGGRNNGSEYFRTGQPTSDSKLDTSWSHALVVYCGQNFVGLTDLWASKSTLHELAHLYHLMNWTEDQPDIQNAWKNAVEKGLYRNVRDSETGEIIEIAYAVKNALEYFAELSACYFLRINYSPDDRKGLKSYDPVGYKMIKKMWNVSDAE